MKKAILAIIIAVSGLAEASACSLFAPCKPRIHHARRAKPILVAPALEARVGKLETQAKLHEEQAAAYVKTISILHQHLAELRARIIEMKHSSSPSR